MNKDLTEEKREETTPLQNIVSDETGQHDARFMLWRVFCIENNVTVETLPGDLTGEAKDKWEQMKAKQLPDSIAAKKK